MFRFFFILLAAVGIAGGVAFWQGWLDPYIAGGVNIGPSQAQAADSQRAAAELGELLYGAKPLGTYPAPQRVTPEIPIEALATVPLVGKQDVSPQREGKILFVGDFAKENVPLPPGTRKQPVPVFDGEKEVVKWFIPLKEGQVVKENDILVVMDPSVVDQEVRSKKVQITASEADYEATKKILTVTSSRLAKLESIRSQPGGQNHVTDQELEEARVTVARYFGEMIVKQQTINKSTFELSQARLIQHQHYLRSEMPGLSIVKKIYKGRGEGAKPQEPVLQLWNISNLSIEGSIDSQYFRTLLDNKNAKCYLEPAIEVGPAPPEQMNFHSGEVNSVAVCSDGEHFVSAGEDHWVFVWQRGVPHPVQRLPHPSAVRAIAANPKSMQVIAGCADGSITVWDLSVMTKPKSAVLNEKHRKKVAALAFSPEGDYFASGGEDSAIMVWKTSGQRLYVLDRDNGIDDAHNSTITSLNFTPQCTLVSAAQDNTIRIWELHTQGAKRVLDAISNRHGQVRHLGVSTDGKYILFDVAKGKTLHMLNAVTGAPMYAIENLAGSNPFDTLALFSPDGEMILTGGAGEGRLQLWKAPTESKRSYQLRELKTKERVAITCASFAPRDKGFAVTGSKDGAVNLWNLPTKEAVASHIIEKDAEGNDLRLDAVDPDLNAGKTRVAVRFQNPQDAEGRHLLSPGQRVTLVVILGR